MKDKDRTKYFNIYKIVIENAEDLKDVNDVCAWVGDPAVDGYLW